MRACVCMCRRSLLCGRSFASAFPLCTLCEKGVLMEGAQDVEPMRSDDVEVRARVAKQIFGPMTDQMGEKRGFFWYLWTSHVFWMLHVVREHIIVRTALKSTRLTSIWNYELVNRKVLWGKTVKISILRYRFPETRYRYRNFDVDIIHAINGTGKYRVEK